MVLHVAPFCPAASRHVARLAWTSLQAFFSPSFTGRRCRQADEGRRKRLDTAPHPYPLPVIPRQARDGERGASPLPHDATHQRDASKLLTSPLAGGDRVGGGVRGRYLIFSTLRTTRPRSIGLEVRL